MRPCYNRVTGEGEAWGTCLAFAPNRLNDFTLRRPSIHPGKARGLCLKMCRPLICPRLRAGSRVGMTCRRCLICACWRIGAGLGMTLTVATPAFAQSVDSLKPCDGMGVRSISVETARPEFRGAAGVWRKFARTLGLHHHTTNAGVVRRFVSLDPQRGCTEFRRAESERILRAQPYLADATVTTRSVGEDSVHVDVWTVDEVPVVGSARLRQGKIAAGSLGTLNFMGTGMHVEGRWETARGQRQGIGGRIAHPQLLGRPYAVILDGYRRSIGEYYSVSAQHPFYTDLQRIAWTAGYATSKDFAWLRRTDRSQLIQPLDRATWNVGGVLRVGPPRKLWLVGWMLIGERVVTRDDFFEVDSLSGRLVTSTDTIGVRRYPTHDVTNAAGVLGVRALSYSRMRGLDALTGEQDVASGTQVGVLFGMQPWGRAPLRNSFGLVDAYAGARSLRNFIAVRTEVESRLDLRDMRSSHIVGSGRAAWYFKPMAAWTSELSSEFGGAWRTLMPFQLELGDRQGGLRGYARSHEAGGQRVIGRLEQRRYLGRFRGQTAGIGLAAFAEAGKIWAGDAPFGVETPIRVAAGLAILASVPARSQRTMRAEVALPFSREQGARTELRFVVREAARGFWTEPPRLRSARIAAAPKHVFTWP
jgi:hypothetical protein